MCRDVDGNLFAFNAKLAKPMGKSKATDDQTQYRTQNQHTMYMITPNIYTARFLYRIFELYDEKRSSTKIMPTESNQIHHSLFRGVINKSQRQTSNDK